MSGASFPVTHSWVEASGGALDSGQRRAARAAIARNLVGSVCGIASWPFRRVAPVEAPRPPDSRIAREAEEAAKDQGPTLAGHGYRTWSLGHALAAHDQTSVDPELFYVASLLHDVGLAAAVTGEDFTIRSARAVTEVAIRTCADRPDVATTLADAVVAHATPGLTADLDPIGFYVQAGAMADLAALRRWHLPKGYMRAAYDAHPGWGIHATVARSIRDEAYAVPEGRFAMLHRAGTSQLIRFSPNRRLDRF